MQGTREHNDPARGLNWLRAAAAAMTAEAVRRWFRGSCLFDPSAEPEISWDPADYGLDGSAVEERFFPNEDGDLLHGWYCRAERSVASILFCHGNSANLTSAAGAMRFLVERGLSVLLFDYRGYGKSTGRPSIRGVLADARAAAAEHARLCPPGVSSLAYGYSLGGAIAAQTARRHPFDGLILQSTFTNFAEITRRLYPNLPIEWLCGDHLDTAAAVSAFPEPVLIIHGSSDEVVPCSMGRRLFELCCGPRMIEIIDGALHKDMELIHACTVADAVCRFITQLVSRDSELLGACA